MKSLLRGVKASSQSFAAYLFKETDFEQGAEKETAVLPWALYSGPEKQKVKDAVLKLSRIHTTFLTSGAEESRKRSFYRPPVYYNTEGKPLQSRSALSEAMLAGDEFLRRIRYVLVPRTLNEDVFWSRYFRRLDFLLGQMKAPDIPETAKGRASFFGQEMYPVVAGNTPATVPEGSRPTESAAADMADKKVKPEEAAAAARAPSDELEEDFDALLAEEVLRIQKEVAEEV